MGKKWKPWQALFWGPESRWTRLQPWNYKMLAPWKKSYDQPRQHVEKQRHYFTNKGPSSQGYGFSSSHVWIRKLDCEESWAPNNWCFWTVMLEKTLESPLDYKEFQQVHPKGNQSEYSLEGLMLKLKLQYFGHLMWRADSFEKTLMINYIFCSQRRRSSIHSAKTRPGAECGSDHELLIAKFRLKLKKVGKTTRAFRYDLSQSLMTIQWKWEIDLGD